VKDNQEGIQVLHLKEKGKKIYFLRTLSNRKTQKRQHFGCKDTVEAQESKNPLRIREQSSGGTVLLYAQVRIPVMELVEERRQRSKPLNL
jgi:hypothetical protein